MLITQIDQVAPALGQTLRTLAPVHDADALWPLLERLLTAHAPSGGAALAGGIGDVIATLADELGLAGRVHPLGATGNVALRVGSEGQTPDVVIVAHMDRPSYRVQDAVSGAIFPISATRFPHGEYRVPAKAVRVQDGRLVVGAEGTLIAQTPDNGAVTLRFETTHGALDWRDTVLMNPSPKRTGARVVGTGLDNCLGTLTALLSAAALRAVEPQLQELGLQCLFVFSDLEEGPPQGFFGHGAARLTYAVPPPKRGCVVVDAQTVGEGPGPALGGGVNYGAASGWGRGSVVPPHALALALDLIADFDVHRPGTVTPNRGYISRSDDMALTRWAPVLALVGPPITDPHTGFEAAQLGDIQGGAWYLAYFLAAMLGIAPEIAARYALRR